MKDKELKLEDVKAPHTLGCASYILFEYIDPAEVGADITLAEVELRKPRNSHATLLTDTRRRVISLAEITVRMPGVELRKPRNLCVCVSEDRTVSEK